MRCTGPCANLQADRSAQNNTLVSTDNKGMAAFLAENAAQPDAMPGNTSFVAGFVQCQSSKCFFFSFVTLSDLPQQTSATQARTQRELSAKAPASRGTGICATSARARAGTARRTATGGTYTFCDGPLADTPDRGPGFRISDYESNRIIGQLQADAANNVLGQKLTPVEGPVRFVHQYVNMYAAGGQRGTNMLLSLWQVGLRFYARKRDGRHHVPCGDGLFVCGRHDVRAGSFLLHAG